MRSQLLKGDQVLIVQRLQQKGVNITPITLSQFLTYKRPMKTIGVQVVQEAGLMFKEREAANQKALQSLRSTAAAA